MSLEGWSRAAALPLFRTWVEEYADALGARDRLGRVGLSAARTRWGSCSPEGKILLSWRLIHFPLHIIDYVIAHEVAHLKELNHGPRFWTTVERLLPGHQAARDELRRYPDGLLPT